MNTNDTHIPIATFFAGVNGSGKTTLYYNEIEKSKNFGFRINIDEIVSSFGNWKESKDQLRASKIAIKMRELYISNKDNFNQETTLCGSSILALFEKLKNIGYSINLHYVGLESVALAKQRVKIRVAKGGHDIKEELIERRYYESLENLKMVTPLCDSIAIYDNSQTMRLIMTNKNKLDSSNIPDWSKDYIYSLKQTASHIPNTKSHKRTTIKPKKGR